MFIKSATIILSWAKTRVNGSYPQVACSI